MTNNAKIRTMQDDIDEAKKNMEEQIKQRQKQQALDIAKENIKKQPLWPKQVQSNQFSSRQAADSDAQQPEKNSVILPEKNREPIFISPEKPIMRSSKKINAAENNELKDLIKRISDETDEDPDYDKDLTKKETDKKDGLQTEKSILATSKTTDKNKDKTEAIMEETLQGVADDLARKNDAREKSGEKEITKKSMGEMEALKKDLNKIEVEEKIREREIASRDIKKTGDLKRNAKEIEDLKKMISRISESSSAKKKTGAKIDNVEEAKKIEDKSASVLPDKNESKSFWKNILEQIKKTGKSRKANDFKNENLTSKVKTGKDGKFEKYSERSGVLQNNNRRKEEPDKKSLSEKAYDENYTPPGERLAQEKQEFYSSVIKKIKPREEKDEMESLKNAAMIKNRQILSKDEEYKKLKYSIAKKYHINLFSLPWKKIISVAVIVIALAGIVSYFVFSETNPFAPIVAPPVVVGNELSIFDGIKERGGITEDTISSLGYLEVVTDYFDKQKGVEILKLIIIDNEQDRKMPVFREALGLIKINPADFSEDFWGIAGNDYNLFIFKTKMETYRLGIAIKLNNIAESRNVMSNWEQETSKDKRMTKVFKGLFLDDPLPREESFIKPFNSTVYKNINIRYIHLPDKDTSLNYFIYNDILVITTSKDSSFLMVDLMVNSPETNR